MIGAVVVALSISRIDVSMRGECLMDNGPSKRVKGAGVSAFEIKEHKH